MQPNAFARKAIKNRLTQSLIETGSGKHFNLKKFFESNEDSATSPYGGDLPELQKTELAPNYLETISLLKTKLLKKM